MNKHQFLAELSQYLSFLSAEDRAKVLEAYTAKFEALGPEQEIALAAELGSPMRVAIELKRRLESGERIVEAPDGAPEEALPDRDSPDGDSPAEEAPAREKPPEEAPEEASGEASGEEAAPEDGDMPADGLEAYSVETETEETLLSEAPPQAEAMARKAAPGAEAMKPFGAKLVFALIGAFLLSLPIVAFFFGLGAVGAGLLVATGHLLTAGLKNLQYLTNALLLFGGGLAALALGLVIIWFSIWSAVRLISGLFGAARREGPRHTDKEAKEA